MTGHLWKQLEPRFIFTAYHQSTRMNPRVQAPRTRLPTTVLRFPEISRCVNPRPDDRRWTQHAMAPVHEAGKPSRPSGVRCPKNVERHPFVVTHSSSASVQHVHPARIDTCVPVGRGEDAGANAQRVLIVVQLSSTKATNRQSPLSRSSSVMHQHQGIPRLAREAGRRGSANKKDQFLAESRQAARPRPSSEPPRKTVGRASRFSSLARPSFSSVPHCRATHAIFLPRTHIPLAFTHRVHRACV